MCPLRFDETILSTSQIFRVRVHVCTSLPGANMPIRSDLSNPAESLRALAAAGSPVDVTVAEIA